ncbi:hypothetical protein SDC9_206611 [bioreactor metagenome]|uniref:Uncharacterized protein n=1 Tax=bioreactor metagenome TaxID=1076179 RepID=A0A645J5A3_9ZZZZ
MVEEVIILVMQVYLLMMVSCSGNTIEKAIIVVLMVFLQPQGVYLHTEKLVEL